MDLPLWDEKCLPVPFQKDESFNSYLSNRPVIVYLDVTVKQARNISGMYCVARGKSRSHEISKCDKFVVWWLVHMF